MPCRSAVEAKSAVQINKMRPLQVIPMAAKAPTNLLKAAKKFIPIDAKMTVKDAVCVFADGSCLNNGKPGAISGVGVYFPMLLEQ